MHAILFRKWDTNLRRNGKDELHEHQSVKDEDD